MQRENFLTESEIVTTISTQLLSFFTSDRFRISDYFTSEADISIFTKFLHLLKHSQEILNLFRIITSLLEYVQINSPQPHLSCLVYDLFSPFILVNQSIPSPLLRSDEDFLLRFIPPSEISKRTILKDILLLIAHSSLDIVTHILTPVQLFSSDDVRFEILRILDYQTLTLNALGRYRFLCISTSDLLFLLFLDSHFSDEEPMISFL